MPIKIKALMQNIDDCFDRECTFWVNFINKARGKSADMHPADRNTWQWNEAAACRGKKNK